MRWLQCCTYRHCWLRQGLFLRSCRKGQSNMDESVAGDRSDRALCSCGPSGRHHIQAGPWSRLRTRGGLPFYVPGRAPARPPRKEIAPPKPRFVICQLHSLVRYEIYEKIARMATIGSRAPCGSAYSMQPTRRLFRSHRFFVRSSSTRSGLPCPPWVDSCRAAAATARNERNVMHARTRVKKACDERSNPSSQG